MAKVFLSYSRKDEDFVEDLFRRLSGDDVECWFDKTSIAWGGNWVCALEEGLDKCSDLIVVLSPDWCQSEWAKLEHTSIRAEDPTGFKKKIRPLLYKPCTGLIPRFLKPLQSIDVSTPVKFETEYPRICKDLGGTPRLECTPEDRSTLPPTCRLPAKHRMPYRSLGKKFVGRVKEIWYIHDILANKQTAVVEGVGVLVGMGGIGKTQLAIEYFHRFGAAYGGGAFWIDANLGIVTMISQVAKAAGISLDLTLEADEQLADLWRALNQHKPVLIVLDNFPENQTIQPWLPPLGSVHVLVTTRRRDLRHYESITVDILTPEEGLALLNKGSRKIGEEGLQLVENLGGLALAVELAGNYLNAKPTFTIEDLLLEFATIGEMQALKIFSKKYLQELPSGHEKAVLTTFQKSWHLLTPSAKKMAEAIASLAAAPVPQRLLRKFLNISEKSVFEDPLDDSVSELLRLSIADLDLENDPSIHRLLSAFIRSTIDEDSDLQNQIIKHIQSEMARARDDNDQDSFRDLEKVLPHADFLIQAESTTTDQAIDIATSLGWHHQSWGRYALSVTYSRMALQLAESAFEPGHPSIAISQSNLAAVLQDLGELEEARDLLRKALTAAQNSFEPGHPSIAISQSNLALVLKDLGKLEEARDLLRKALAADQNRFEPGHPSIAISQSNLAMVLQDLGELEEARDLLRKALTAAQNSFEPGHPSIAIRQSNLAAVLKDLGELEEARDLLRKALAADQNSFEPGHPSIAIRQSNLAMVLKDLGELEEARDLLRKALAADQNSFEPGHPSIAISQSNLAMVLRDLGELEEARDLLRKTLAADQNSFEPGHPSIAISQSNLAAVLQALGELEEARDLAQQAFNSFLFKFGPDHYQTIILKNNLESIVNGQ